MTAERRTWRGVSGDERQLDRRRRLLDAALDISDSQGIASVTVRGVCAEAGLTSRYFYESFTDIGDLLVSLHDELAASAIANVTDGIADSEGGLRERVGGGVNSAIGFLYSEDRRTIRFLLVSATARPDLNERRRRLIAEVSGLGAAAVLRGSGLAVVPPKIEMAARFVLGGLIETSTAFVEGDVSYSLDDLVEGTTELVLILIDQALTSIGGDAGTDR